jgi:hypothetical protein
MVEGKKNIHTDFIRVLYLRSFQPVSVSVIVANLPFIVSICYRFFNKQESNHTHGTSSDGRGRTIQLGSTSHRGRHTIQLGSVATRPKSAVLRGHIPDPLGSWSTKQSNGYYDDLDPDTLDVVDKYDPESGERHNHPPFTLQNPAAASSSNLTHSEADAESPSSSSPKSHTTRQYPPRDEGLVRVEIVTGVDDDDDDDDDERLPRRPLSNSRRLPSIRFDQEVVVSTDPIP